MIYIKEFRNRIRKTLPKKEPEILQNIIKFVRYNIKSMYPEKK